MMPALFRLLYTCLFAVQIAKAAWAHDQTVMLMFVIAALVFALIDYGFSARPGRA